jgi:ABC-type branched-subunit amino acid transport system substrate-binding protein
MKANKLSWYFLLVVSIVLIASLFLMSCGTSTSEPAKAPAATQAPAPAATQAPAKTQAPAPAAPAQTSAQAPAPAPSAAQAPAVSTKTLKIGVVAWFGWPVGLDFVHGIQVMADMDNQNGGWTINGEKYKIELNINDTNNSQSTAVAAVNKLIYQDKVQYILADQRAYEDGWFNLTEPNKIVVSAASSSPPILSPNNKYTFNSGFSNCTPVELVGYLSKAFPDKKTFITAFPDNQDGHNFSNTVTSTLAAFGLKNTNVFYPTTSQDLSSLGTKVRMENPDYFWASAGGPVNDALAIKAVSQAGYKGQIVAATAGTAESLMSVVPPEALEGYIASAWPTEFEPAITEQAKAFKAAYIAKFGKWDGPEIQDTACYASLRSAMQQANSLDSEKVAAAFSNGLKFEGPTGIGAMVPRPDQGNTRTIDSVETYYVKQVVNGKPKLIGTLNIDDAIAAFNKLYAK